MPSAMCVLVLVLLCSLIPLFCLLLSCSSINEILSSIMNTSKMMMHATMLLANMLQPLAVAALDLRSKNSVKEGAKEAELIYNLSECETCALSAQCLSGTCTNLFQCAGDDGNADGDGCTCISDNDCSSGFCSVSLTCKTKLEHGETCLEDDDCATANCGFDFTCQHLLDGGSGCTMNKQCASQECSWFLTCTACSYDAHQYWSDCVWGPSCPDDYTLNRNENGPCWFGTTRIVCDAVICPAPGTGDEDGTGVITE